MARTQYVHTFGEGRAQGSAGMKDLLGGKGAGLAEMAQLGLPVPPGFTISTQAVKLLRSGVQRQEIEVEVEAGLRFVEQCLDRRFGDAQSPLLVSVRSGAAVSMPGMMDTVLNIGLNPETIVGLTRASSNERFAWDSYRRLIQMYGEIVLGLEHAGEQEQSPFAVLLATAKERRGVTSDLDLTAADLQELAGEYESCIERLASRSFPAAPREQLWDTIMAVCDSWDNSRARTYRQIHGIPEDLGTAINVQAMVYGNLGSESGTGVMFTRNPANGERELYGEFLMNAQGEDVVAGVRTPEPIARLADVMPAAYQQLTEVSSILEKHYRDMQDIEFTIENGKVWLLQTRRAKRTGLAALRIAVDMVEEHMFSPKEALLRIEPEQLNHLLRPVFDDTEKKQAIVSGRLLACGLAAGPGAASGKVVFSAARAEELAAAGQPVILVRQETSPEDIKGMYVSQGILTARGGMTSHAALVSRQMGKVCVVGCSELDIDYGKRSLRVKERSIAEGDELSLDGTTGEIIVGNLQTRQSEVLRAVLEQDPASRKSPAYRLYARLMEWADCVRILGIRANADQADQAAVALALGAEGIGLCRTEHMFFGEPKITYMREMILAETEEARKAALAKLLPIQRRDFESLFRTMNGKPVTIRTLDPPLHEFLPQGPDDISRVAATLGIAAEQIEQRLHSLKELNPMLGHRGCRLGITYPEITRMQARAIAEAACQLKKESIDVYPEIMIPLVAYENELLSQVQLVQEEIALVMEEQGVQFAYQIGTMIELPRAALIADVLARTAQFFSFGTNDLTQTALGVSRDDAGRFLTPYLDQNIIPSDPFRSIDRQGVGQLMRFAVEKALSTRPDCKLGICGEQGGDPDSVAFCAELGLDYVSASPYRLPIARLAAAQAALAAGMKKNDKA